MWKIHIQIILKYDLSKNSALENNQVFSLKSADYNEKIAFKTMQNEISGLILLLGITYLSTGHTVYPMSTFDVDHWL